MNNRDRLEHYCVAKHAVSPEGSRAYVQHFISVIQAIYFRVSDAKTQVSNLDSSNLLLKAT